MRKIPYQTNQNHPAIKAYSKAIEEGMAKQQLVQKDDPLIKELESRLADSEVNNANELYLHSIRSIITKLKRGVYLTLSDDNEDRSDDLITDLNNVGFRDLAEEVRQKRWT